MGGVRGNLLERGKGVPRLPAMRNPFPYFNSSPELIRLAVMMCIRYRDSICRGLGYTPRCGPGRRQPELAARLPCVRHRRGHPPGPPAGRADGAAPEADRPAPILGRAAVAPKSCGHRNWLGETRGPFRGSPAQFAVSQPWYPAAMAANLRELRGKSAGPSETGEIRRVNGGAGSLQRTRLCGLKSEFPV